MHLCISSFNIALQAQVPICGWLMAIPWCVTLSGCRGWLLRCSNYFLIISVLAPTLYMYMIPFRVPVISCQLEPLVLKECRMVLFLSAVGMAHVLRSGLVMGYTTSHLTLIVLGYHLDPNRSYGALSDTLWAGAWLRLAPSSSCLRVYMDCALTVVFQVRSLYIP